ncbi:pantothenate transporter liz1 [Ophiostoma piceae UAMH 11346]|uniref:Pantothenate transporter liz1 n=1 Tax=Ophiostoma piceae (strain UAMH 11346) TaxID=1262450 RepID=S3C0B4_OPHP1|nr:pantothenate transporter liz1 [Ophiostoma piceae UAMH 11346]
MLLPPPVECPSLHLHDTDTVRLGLAAVRRLDMLAMCCGAVWSPFYTAMSARVESSKETAHATQATRSTTSAEDLHAHDSTGAPTSDAAPVDKDGLTTANHAAAERLVSEKPKQTWRSNLWDTLDKSPEERKFLFKLDTIVLTFASLGYFIKYLDQVNLNNAFVSGMEEDLKLYGNQLNYMVTCWTVGYVIGEVPSNLILTRIRPSIWIPSCEVLWATLTIIQAKCSNSTQLYVLRFFIGLAESTFYPGMQYIIGSWYRREELAKRSCIFHAASAIGTMFSGYLMAAVYHLDGVHGYKGWQWLFIIDTVISMPVAIAGFFMLPDVPEITRAWYFTPDEIAIAKRRMVLEGRANRAPFTKAKVKRIFKSWHIYLLTLLYILFNNGNGYGGQPAFQLWLKKEGYSVSQYNVYPTLTSAVQVVSTFAYAWSSDTIFKGSRWPPIVFSAVFNFIVYVSLSVWNIPHGWKWACYLLAGLGGGISGLTFAWAHEICKDDNEERALVTGTMNEMAYVFQAWLPLLVWQKVDAPYYKKGFIMEIFIAVSLIVTTFVIRSLHRKELLQKQRELPNVDSGNEEAIVPVETASEKTV